MNKKLHRVDVVLYVMAEDEFEACWAATKVRFEPFECVAAEAKSLDPEWEEAVPYNADDDRTCSEIVSNQMPMARPRSRGTAKNQSDPNEAATPTTMTCTLRQRAEATSRINEAQPSVRLSPQTSVPDRAEPSRVRPPRSQRPRRSGNPDKKEIQQILHELRVHQIELEMQNEELRRTQAELELSRARYFDLYQLAPVGYITLSEPGLILQANLIAAGLLGLARNAVVNQPVTRFIVAEDQDIYYQHRRQLMESGAPQVCELRLRRADATATFWARLEMTVTQEADGAPMCRVVISDITERVCSEQGRRQVEAALRASEARYRELADENARLLAGSRQEAETKAILLHEVNHRVKNYLAAIIVLLQLELGHLGSRQLTPYRSLVEDLTSRIQSLALVHNLLSANRWAPLPLELLAENVMQIAPIMLSRQQPVQMEISPTAVHLSAKQASAVGLILNELATNSLKHGLRPNEPICLSLQTHPSGDEVDLEYRDNGPGYPERTSQGKRESVGLFLIEALAEHDLGGKVTFSNDHGAVARLHFALAPDVQPVGSQAPTS